MGVDPHGAPKPSQLLWFSPPLTPSFVSPIRGLPHPSLPLFYKLILQVSTVPFRTFLASHDSSAFFHFLCLNLFCTSFKFTNAGPGTSFHSTPLLS